MASSIFLWPGLFSTDGSGAITFNGAINVPLNDIRTTSTDGLALTNLTPATLAVPVQYSPRLKFTGSDWDTDTLINRTTSWFIENRPVSNTNNIGAGLLAFSWIDSTGAITTPMQMASNNGSLTITGGINLNSPIAAQAFIGGLFNGSGYIYFPSDGRFRFSNFADSIGIIVKVDALPTIASGGGGTTPASITAGSTPLAGSVNVGTGVITSPIVINFNGTAFPSAPFVVCNDGQTAIAVRATASTTQLTLTSAAFVANDVISWICISAK